MSEMTDARAVEVLAAMRDDGGVVADADYTAAIDHVIARMGGGEAHCATCSCVPGMTPAVRFNTTPAEREGAVRDHLIRMGWTPPAEAQAQGGGEVVAHYCEHRHKCKWHAAGAWPLFGTEEDRLQEWKDVHAARCGGRILPLAPPSAPVGVKAYPLWQAIHAASEKAGFTCNVGLSQVADALAALAQQPAADEEAAEQYRKGWKAGHAAAQKPEAVDGVLVELVATLAATGTVTGGRIYFPERQTRELLKRACDTLAVQPVGSDNDR